MLLAIITHHYTPTKKIEEFNPQLEDLECVVDTIMQNTILVKGKDEAELDENIKVVSDFIEQNMNDGYTQINVRKHTL